MEHILDHIKSSRVTLNAQPDEFDHQHASDDSPTSDESADESGDEVADEQPSQARKQKRLQTMVFSATLTLPQRLRSRFKKGVVFLCCSCPVTSSCEDLHHTSSLHDSPKQSDLSRGCCCCSCMSAAIWRQDSRVVLRVSSIWNARNCWHEKQTAAAAAAAACLCLWSMFRLVIKLAPSS